VRGSKASFGDLRRTGRVRPRRASRGSALGIRNLLESHECECQLCRHVGWYSHKGVLRLKMVNE
jgi:hypothetical protein